MARAAIAIVLVLLLAPATWIGINVFDCRVDRDIAYLPSAGAANRLDLYRPPGSRPRPTLVYFHGGGWLPASSKKDVDVWKLPFLYLGWNIANVEYRRSDIAKAPQALADSICAVEWLNANAARYQVDTSRLVLMGDSAGGQLALAAGMIPSSGGLNGECADLVFPRIGAIISWAGVTDLNDLLDGPGRREFALSWIPGGDVARDVALRVSPISYARKEAPPIFLVHANQDTIVPYDQALRLDNALKAAGARSRLLTINGVYHVGMPALTTLRVYQDMLWFLHDNGIRILP